MKRNKLRPMVQRMEYGERTIRAGAFHLVGLLLALTVPNSLYAACGPGTINNPCVYFHSSASATTGPTPANSLTVSFTVPLNSGSTSCTNGFLTVPVALMRNVGNVSAVSTVTYGGVAMALQAATAGTSDLTNDLGRKRVEMWTLGTPTPGTANVVVTLPAGQTAQIVGGAIMSCGVDQTTPFIGRTFGNNQGANNLAQVGVSSANYAQLLDIIATDGNVTATVGNGETNTWNVTSGTGAGNVRGSSSHKSSALGFEVPTYNLGANTYWALGALTLRPWSPTAIDLESFDALSYDRGAVLRWHTGHEANTLGFQVYREVEGQMIPVNRDVIVGSGLSFSRAALQAGYSYSWFDPAGRPGDAYWLEDVELGGGSAWHGPFPARQAHGRAPRVARSQMLGETSRALSQAAIPDALFLEGYNQPLRPSGAKGADARQPDFGVGRVTSSDRNAQWKLAAAGAAKIEISAAGWYRLEVSALEAEGFHVADPARLQLFADGVEQSIRINLSEPEGGGPAAASIEFFGVSNDTPASGERVYWLINGHRTGLRINRYDVAETGNATVGTVPFTVQIKERLIYVPGILNGESENFFGQAITADPAIETVFLDNLAESSGQDATLQVALQGLTEAPFTVEVALNGTMVGEIEIDGASWRQASFTIPPAGLTEGENTITLRRTDEESIALVDTIQLSYPRLTEVGNGQTVFYFPAEMEGHEVRLDGFASDTIRVIDISRSARPVELRVPTGRNDSGYYADVVIPEHRGGTILLALADEHVAAPAGILLDTPSKLHTAERRAGMVIIGPAAFLPAADPLRAFHESEGLSVEMVDIQDVYDEFSHGAKDPAALRFFLERTKQVWDEAPRFVLLLGDGSYDPRDYLGFDEDLVPTKLIDTDTYETASDDWFADFDDDGIPSMSIGRLPVASSAEAADVIRKIVRKEAAGVSLASMLTVADEAIGDNFTLINQRLSEVLPPQTAIQVVNADDMGAEAARQIVLDAVDAGVDFLNYSGHGTVDRWRADVLTSQDAAALKNGDHLTVFTMMNCLNGVFQEPLLEGLGEALILAPDGGAVAVWASSATTTPPPQEQLMEAFFRALAEQPGTTIGEAATQAKEATDDLDVRRTWILLGDPAMKIEGAQ